MKFSECPMLEDLGTILFTLLDKCFPSWQWRLDSLHEEHRTKANDPRLWVEEWTGKEYLLNEITGSYRIEDLVVQFKLAASKSEAQRLIKANAIETRPWDLSEWWRKCKLKEEIPEGEPVLLRKGKAYLSHTIMRPSETQTLKGWRAIIKER